MSWKNHPFDDNLKKNLETTSINHIKTDRVGSQHRLDTKIHPTQLVEIDPKRCKPWPYHNRDKDWLTKERCADLISSIQRDGQLEPILVRKITGDPNFDYEIIYGVRRAFACAQIPNQPVIAQITDLDDKTCMILMHSENANSKDISEFERAFSFAKQMKSGYFKNQTEMAEIMGVSQGMISKMIKAAEIFEVKWIEALFKSKIDIPVKPAYALSLLLKKTETYERVKQEAYNIQKTMEKTGSLPGSKILHRLITAAQKSVDTSFESIILSANHKPVVYCRRDKTGRFTIIVEEKAKTLKPLDIENACIKAIKEQILNKLFPGNNFKTIANPHKIEELQLWTKLS